MKKPKLNVANYLRGSLPPMQHDLLDALAVALAPVAIGLLRDARLDHRAAEAAAEEAARRMAQVCVRAFRAEHGSVPAALLILMHDACGRFAQSVGTLHDYVGEHDVQLVR